MTDRSKEQPFDERLALDALEQFQSEIKRYRHEREVVTNDFETFVRTLPSADEVFPTENPSAPSAQASPPAAHTAAPTSVKAPPEVPAPPAAVPPVRASQTAQPPATSVERQTPTPAPGGDFTPSRKPSIPTVDTHSTKTTDAEPAIPITPTPTRSKAPLLAALLLIALVIAGAAYWNARGGTPREAGTSAPLTEATPPATAAPEAPAAVPAAPSETPVPTGSEIRTLRPVWVRVMADGERVVERELPAGAKIPFTAEKAIVIRTGDAGAVQLTIRGDDQGTLGRDGAVVTRTFTVPGSDPR